MKHLDKEKLVEQAIVDSIDENALLGDKSKILVDNMPTSPDPFWPPGAEPTHLPLALQKSEHIREAYRPLVGTEWHCRKCGGTQNQSKEDETLCRLCETKEAQNTALAKKTNDNWMEEAKELGLETFERQPAETDLEWRIWEKYRSYYPLKLPTYAELALATGFAQATVVKAAQRWSYKVRLIDWARYTDADVQQRRIETIREMNERQLKMTTDIQKKIEDAIQYIKPEMLKPGELVNLFKMATDLERKISTYAEERVKQDAVADAGNRNTGLTKTENLEEVIAILQKTGVLGSKTVGIEQTTKVILKDGDKNEHSETNVYTED